MILATDLWVRALLRRIELGGAFATLARRGDDRAGAVLVKIFDPRGGAARLYQLTGRGESEAAWIAPRDFTSEADIDAYIEKAGRIDPDLWVVEIEDAKGARFLTEPVVGGGP